MIFEAFKMQQHTHTDPPEGSDNRTGVRPWSCGSARCPGRIQQCEAPWIRHTGTQPGPQSRSCRRSRCSPSRGMEGDRDRRERDRGSVSVGRTEGGPKTTSSRDGATQSLFRSDKSTSLERNCKFIDEKMRREGHQQAEELKGLTPLGLHHHG